MIHFVNTKNGIFYYYFYTIRCVYGIRLAGVECACAVRRRSVRNFLNVRCQCIKTSLFVLSNCMSNVYSVHLYYVLRFLNYIETHRRQLQQ